MIRLREISKTFGSGPTPIRALDGVSLDIDRAEIFGVIGHSGAGKSTLIRLLNGLESPTSGEVTVAGQRIDSATETALRAIRPRIGMIFQHFNLLWSRTVRGNIALALQIAGRPRAEIAPRVDELIRLVGLEGRANAYPAQLSGGQKQRVGIARALANAPDVLLCDEATSALDPETTEQILDLLARINRDLGLTIVLITHEMAVVRRICHRVAVMEGGRVVETGPVAQVFAAPQAEATRRMLRETGDGALALNAALPDAAGFALRHGVAVTLLPRPGHVLRLDGSATAVAEATAALAAAGLNPREV